HVGLVGANGEGKTTFLNIITGKLEPEAGSISWCKRITSGYLDQKMVLPQGTTIRQALKMSFDNLFNLEKEMLALYEKTATCLEDEYDTIMEDAGEIGAILEHSGFYNIDSKIEEYANGLGLGEIGLDKEVDMLSGGQRSKVLLTKLLLENPMILILDEPTNFLDEDQIKWLTNFLKEYENAFILVSHDIPFLNDVTNVIYHIENAQLTRYTGSYDEFIAAYELKKQQVEKAYEKQQKEIESLQTFIAKNKARASTATLARSRMKKLEKMDIIEISKEKIKPTFSFNQARTPGRVVISCKDLIIGYDTPLTKPLSLEIERNKKIAIKGVNGIGKSTLIKSLIGEIKPISGEIEQDQFIEIGYFEQENDGSSATALEEVWHLYPSMTNAEVRAALAKCGLTTEHITSQMKVLSGGEAAKVRLCKLMLSQNNILVLDEPTNHLDVLAKESLKEAIINFKGTILLVCHEPEFYEDVATDIWDVSDWSLKII
ncbi:MAG: ABC-F family ATP-binding cassette domain-containing protein, partial [Oscillospiraceae bacterium]